jgi:predicted nucleic acid-binding Zn ribbon protein
MQGISDEPLKRCPSCGTKVTKLISLSAFHLKGSGWYATDYAKKDGGKETKAKGDGEAKTDGEAKGGEAKPTATGETSGAAPKEPARTNTRA